MRILVTGSNGAIGRVVCPALARAGHDVVRLDARRDENDTQTIVGDIAEPGVVERAAAGCEAIIHLAAFPHGQRGPLTERFVDKLLRPNVMGLLHVCDAAVSQGVKKLILASTIQVIGGMKNQRPVGTDIAAPTNDYSLTKQWAEDAGALVTRRHGLSVLAVRIGWFVRNREEAESLAKKGAFDAYLSHDDAARFFRKAAEAAFDGYHIVYALSRPRSETPFVDFGPGRRVIGYEPQDIFPNGTPFAEGL